MRSLLEVFCDVDDFCQVFLPALNNQTRLTQMADEPDLIATPGQPVEGEIEPPEMAEGGFSVGEPSRFDLSKERVFGRPERC